MKMTNLDSDAFVFFGATGDLAYKQIFPALQAMIRCAHFDMPIIGVARSAKGLDQLRARARASVEQHGGLGPGAFATLSARLQYVNGDYGFQQTFRDLRKALGGASRPLYYLAIPRYLAIPPNMPPEMQWPPPGIPQRSPEDRVIDECIEDTLSSETGTDRRTQKGHDCAEQPAIQEGKGARL
jgi:hypothetical protein